MASGLPEVDSLATVGGVRVDYAPVEDASTDVPAAHLNLVFANVAAMTQTCDRAWCAFVGKASSPPDDPSSNVHGAVWGNGVSVKPVTARTSTGLFTLTWPTSVTDELGVSHSVNLRRAHATWEGATLFSVNATVTAPNVVTVRVWNAAGSLNDGVGTTFTIFVT